MIKATVEGWVNFVFENDKAETTARKRAEICSRCDHAKKMKYEVIKDNRIKQLSRYCCELCGCPLSTLTRQSKKTCKIGKW